MTGCVGVTDGFVKGFSSVWVRGLRCRVSDGVGKGVVEWVRCSGCVYGERCMYGKVRCGCWVHRGLWWECMSVSGLGEGSGRVCGGVEE